MFQYKLIDEIPKPLLIKRGGFLELNIQEQNKICSSPCFEMNLKHKIINEVNYEL